MNTSFSDVLLFCRKFIENPKQNASVIPSSRHAAISMVEGIDFDKVNTIVEFGPGTGIFTSEILKHTKKNTKLILIELESSYNDVLMKKFGDSVIIENTGAENVEAILSKHGLTGCDLIISSLPFALPEVCRLPLFESISRLTQKGTVMRFFTYNPPAMKKVYHQFPLKFHKFVLWNFPPMFIYELKCDDKE